MQSKNHAFSQTTTLVLVVIAVILFGYLGYWYGSNHSGGFSTVSIKDFDITSSDPAKDHPGQISRSTINSNELIYSNKTIGLSFTVPENWHVG